MTCSGWLFLTFWKVGVVSLRIWIKFRLVWAEERIKELEDTKRRRKNSYYHKHNTNCKVPKELLMASLSTSIVNETIF